MRANYCLIPVSWVALICYICVGRMYSKVSLRVEFIALLGGYYYVFRWGISHIDPKMYVYLEFLGCGFWTRYNRFLLLGCFLLCVGPTWFSKVF